MQVCERYGQRIIFPKRYAKADFCGSSGTLNFQTKVISGDDGTARPCYVSLVLAFLIAELVDMAAVTAVLPDVEACARELRATKRNTVKHNRGTHIFEAGNIRFGLEMRRLAMGDGGLAIHVLADIGGTPGKKYTEETELLAFDHFWNGAHYHYGPRNKNHRIYWDRTLVEDPLAWTLEQFEKGKLPAMIERAGYPGVAADLDVEKIASVLPAMKKQALDMWEQGRRLTGHPGLPLEPTPNLGAAD